MLLGSSGMVNWVTNPLKNICENVNTLALGGVHLVVLAHLQRRSCWSWIGSTWRREREVFRCTPNYRMALDLEFCIDPLCFGSNMQVGCVALWINFSKYSRSSKSEFEAKSYSRFSAERSVIGHIQSVFLTHPGVTDTRRESNKWWPNVFGHQKGSLEPLWKWPDSGRVEFGHRRKGSLVNCAEACWWPDSA